MQLRSFRGAWHIDWHNLDEVRRDIEDVCEALTKINLRKLRLYALPPLRTSGVRYHQIHDEDAFQDCVSTYRQGYGDCDDLACWRAAEIRKQGYDAKVEARFEQVSGSDFKFHVFVRLGSGEIDDPTLYL